MKKLGLISLALVVALGVLGVGYAMWSDTVTIDGTVETGSVDIVVESLSHTYVYKVIQAYGNYVVGDIIFSPTPLALDQGGSAGDELLLVSSAVTSQDNAANDQDITMTFTNLFPTTTANISCDVVMHYMGTIPAHVELTALTYGVTTGADLTPYLNVEWFSKPSTSSVWTKVATPEALQLHKCDRMKVVINFDLPQDNTLMCATGTIDGSILVKQWNE